MILLVIVVALLLEQVRPLAPDNRLRAAARRWPSRVARNIDRGQPVHAWLAWGLAAVAPALLAGLVHALLQWLGGWLLTLAWAIAVLYATLGLRRFSQHFVGVRNALERNDEEGARQLLAQWLGRDIGSPARPELIRLVLEQLFVSAHRLVFGVLAWFCLLAMAGLGPAGAVFYRMAEVVARQWRCDAPGRQGGVSAALGQVAARAWWAIDWLPARMTGLGLAIVGSFEEAVDAWRQHASRFASPNDGVIISAAAGALGVRLGGTLSPRSAGTGLARDAQPGHGDPLPGETPALHHLPRAVGLLWRFLALWLLLLVLLTAAHVFG